MASRYPLGHGAITNQNAGSLTVYTAGIADVDSHNSLLNPDDARTLEETTTLYDALRRGVASTVWLQPLGLVDVSNPPIAGFGGVAGTQGLTTQKDKVRTTKGDRNARGTVSYEFRRNGF